MPGQWHSQPTLTSFGEGYACIGVTCYLHFWQVPLQLCRGGMDTE